ncbi:unnamed protein product, partial [Laminaria digitata]
APYVHIHRNTPFQSLLLAHTLARSSALLSRRCTSLCSSTCRCCSQVTPFALTDIQPPSQPLTLRACAHCMTPPLPRAHSIPHPSHITRVDSLFSMIASRSFAFECRGAGRASKLRGVKA